MTISQAMTSIEGKDSEFIFIDKSKFEDPFPPFSNFNTISDNPIPNVQKTPLPYEEAEIILSEIEGVILEVEENTVRVKLASSTYVNLPNILFNDPSNIILGQRFRYVLKKDEEGYRYQEIIPIRGLSSSNPRKESILNLLDQIKYKDE